MTAPIITTFHLPAGAQAVSGDDGGEPGGGGLAGPVITNVCEVTAGLYQVFGTAPPNVLIQIFNNSSCSGAVQNSIITDGTGNWADQFVGPNGNTFTARYETLTDPVMTSLCSTRCRLVARALAHFPDGDTDASPL